MDSLVTIGVIDPHYRLAQPHHCPVDEIEMAKDPTQRPDFHRPCRYFRNMSSLEDRLIILYYELRLVAPAIHFIGVPQAVLAKNADDQDLGTQVRHQTLGAQHHLVDAPGPSRR